MAARLVWQGGDDVYGAGQRDVAALYEYWVFFRLLDIVCNAFDLDKPSANQLIEETSDGFGLKIKSGQQMDFVWSIPNGSRSLRVQYSYNRSFTHKTDGKVEGSWTARMRPDYTLSFWPNDFTAHEAEAQELMTHVHFDAKYRIENVQQLFGSSDEELTGTGKEVASDLESEKQEQKEGRYKRADLLKMHAYRDAIRRTHGAYVIYPGTESRRWECFHEILPGLGAFPLRPGKGELELESFLIKVAEHACYRASAREQHGYHTYKIYQTEEYRRPYLDNLLQRTWPEHEGNVRLPPPAEISVLVGSCENPAHLNWMFEKQLYDIQIKYGSEIFRLSPEVSSAKYLLLQETQGNPHKLFEISGDGPRIFSKNDLLSTGYPLKPIQELYLIFDIELAGGFEQYEWDYTHLSRHADHAHDNSFEWPFVTTLDKVLDVSKPVATE